MPGQPDGAVIERPRRDSGSDVATSATARQDLDHEYHSRGRMNSAQGTRSGQQGADRGSKPGGVLQQQRWQDAEYPQPSQLKSKPSFSRSEGGKEFGNRSWLLLHQVQLSDGSIVIPARHSSRKERFEGSYHHHHHYHHYHHHYHHHHYHHHHQQQQQQQEQQEQQQGPRYPFSPDWTSAWKFQPREDAHTIEWEVRPLREEVRAAKKILERSRMADSRRSAAKSWQQQNGLHNGLRNTPKQRQSTIKERNGIIVKRLPATTPPIARPRLVIREDSFEDGCETESDHVNLRYKRRLADDQSKLRGPFKSDSSLQNRQLSLQRTDTQKKVERTALSPLRETSFHSEGIDGSNYSIGGERSPVLDHIRLDDDVPIATLAPLERPDIYPPDSLQDLSDLHSGSSHDFDDFDGCYLENLHGRSRPRGEIPRRRSSFKGTQSVGNRSGSLQARGNNGDSTQNGLLQPNVLRRRRYSDDLGSTRRGNSIKSKAASDGQQDRAISGSARMPDFFGPNVYQIVLQDPITAHQLLKFSESRLCGENVEFLQKVDQYRRKLGELSETLNSIQKDYVSSWSTKQINLPGAVRKRLDVDMRFLVSQMLPQMKGLFTDAQHGVEDLIYADIYPAFVRHQLALSASRALAQDRSRYQGLGDCFTLTDPRKVDNPIVFASDGFVSLTGYTMGEIISNNCRILQGKQTEKQAIARIRTAIREETEIVELVLNYKKNGDPFWNLLYIAPLFDEKGQVAFYMGGQVNCSTTIHSSADVMRVLSMSSNPSETDLREPRARLGEITVPQSQSQSPPLTPPPRKSSARKVLLKAFGVRTQEDDQSSAQELPGIAEAGMLPRLLSKMEGQDFDAQMREFYTAYSKYMVLDATLKIRFYSAGILSMLHPANNVGELAGTEIFRFLRQNTLSSSLSYPAALNGHGHAAAAASAALAPSLAYKGRIRAALRAGSAISIQVRLQTRRSAAFRGDEVFSAHWTPLKDGKGEVCWVVLCLGAILGQ